MPCRPAPAGSIRHRRTSTIFPAPSCRRSRTAPRNDAGSSRDSCLRPGVMVGEDVDVAAAFVDIEQMVAVAAVECSRPRSPWATSRGFLGGSSVRIGPSYFQVSPLSVLLARWISRKIGCTQGRRPRSAAGRRVSSRRRRTTCRPGYRPLTASRAYAVRLPHRILDVRALVAKHRTVIAVLVDDPELAIDHDRAVREIHVDRIRSDSCSPAACRFSLRRR